MTELSLAAITRIAKNAGVDRVGKDAEEMLAKMAEEYIAQIATEAFKYAKHAGRVTIKVEDLKVLDGRSHTVRVL